MKKWVCLFLALLMTCGMAACSSETTSDTAEEASSAASSSSASSSAEAESEASSELSSAVESKAEASSTTSEETKNPVAVEATGNYHQTKTLDDLTDEQIAIFRQVVDDSGAEELINEGLMTVEDMDREQNYMIDIYISTNVLPENGKELFREWKEGEGYYSQFSGSTSGTSGTTGTVENGGSTGGVMGGSTAGNSSESTEEVIEVVPPTNTNKPDPSEGQKAEQDEATGEEEGLFEGLTWENKAEREQALNDLMDSASGGQPQGGVTLDPDVEW